MAEQIFKILVWAAVVLGKTQRENSFFLFIPARKQYLENLFPPFC
jgi:hypothetical protein